MSIDPFLNVFSGERALHDFYDPDKGPLIPLVELPERLNPYKNDGVQIFAKLMSHVPATNVKSLPALNMILRGQEKGKITDDTHTLVEYSSGSTVISMGMLANIYGIQNTKAYLSNKTSPTKLDLLRFFGLDLTLFAGHGQPEPLDPNGGIFTATQDGQQEGYYNPDQYSNPENYDSHMRWTGPQIFKQLPSISVFAASIGTSGTMTGTGLYLKSVKPSITRVGVCTSPGERVPGPRMFSLLAPVEFPWREAVDCIEEIGPFDSYEKSLHLCRNGLLVGPSSGLALLGLFKFLDKKKAAGELDSLRNPDGNIPCAFICCDQPFQYISEYFDKLGPSYFLPIRNSELIGVDPYNYNVDWEITPTTAHEMLTVALTPGASASALAVLDLRDAPDFAAAHIPGALNLPLGIRTAANPYKHPPTMVEQFKLLDARLGAADTEFGNDSTTLQGKIVLTLSYKGHVGRLAMSVLRNRGLIAHCVMGGVDAWEADGLWAQSCAVGLEINVRAALAGLHRN
ncbi:tryptophan synthase beta subunit-like PLP-dependent enzyme [Mycena metata]|uniref:Tryptophan synthase beta subunit-like PLP-dependent enzyme n=1 Tax=Mycena metata TaxID=1033252 RepID=A0AAD7MU20_9AGAR|nr:tryptophan synthase beta subunit-like PLP-dependent enzyme [Mycena metata]